MSDAEYDRLFHELEALEALHPDLKTPTLLPKRVGASPRRRSRSIATWCPCLSLDNAFDDAALAAWENGTRGWAPR